MTDKFFSGRRIFAPPQIRPRVTKSAVGEEMPARSELAFFFFSPLPREYFLDCLGLGAR